MSEEEPLVEEAEEALHLVPKRQLQITRARMRMRCPYGCNRSLASRTIEYHRTNGCRMGVTEPLGDSDRKKNYCCGVCYSEFVTRNAFFEHMSAEHDVRAGIHRLTFTTKALFDRFVRWMEREGGAHFRHKSGAKRRSSGKGIFMGCNRTGTICSNRARLPPRVGPTRTGYTCTAFIHGTEFPDGSVSAEFCGDHYGHDARMRLPNIIKQLIAQKQLDGESPVQIIQYLRHQFRPLAAENVFAARVCMVDPEELRTLMITTTKKWEAGGIPMECEIWEEELLDAVGIFREGMPRLRDVHEKTTDQLAEEFNWPRPHVFVARLKTPQGDILMPELKNATAELRRNIGTVEKYRGQQEEPTVDVETVAVGGGESSVEDEEDQAVHMEETHPCNTGRIQAAGKRMGNSLTKARMLKNMSVDLQATDRMVRLESGNMTGPCLVAFFTRIRSLRNAYQSLLNPRSKTTTDPTAGDGTSTTRVTSSDDAAEAVPSTAADDKNPKTEEGDEEKEPEDGSTASQSRSHIQKMKRIFSTGDEKKKAATPHGGRKKETSFNSDF